MNVYGLKVCFQFGLALLLVLSFSVGADPVKKPNPQTKDITLDVAEDDEEPKVNTIQLPSAEEMLKASAKKAKQSKATGEREVEREERERTDDEPPAIDRPGASFSRSRSREGRDRDKDRD